MAGAAPSFGEVHVVRTLLFLSAGRAGRKSLVGVLGVGEGSVRTIIKRLKAEGLVESKPRGHALSPRGGRTVAALLRRFAMPQDVELDIVPGKRCCVTVAHNAAGKISTGVGERELAVRAGADGALLLRFSGGCLGFPCGDVSLDPYPGTKLFLEGVKLREGDVVVVGFSAVREKAADGALSIALGLS